MDDLGKAGPAGVEPRPDLTLADLVLGDGDHRGPGLEHQRQGTADQARSLGQQVPGGVGVDSLHGAAVGRGLPVRYPFGEPAANGERQSGPGLSRQQGPETKVGEIADGRIELDGDRAIVQTMQEWLGLSPFAKEKPRRLQGVRPAL